MSFLCHQGLLPATQAAALGGHTPVATPTFSSALPEGQLDKAAKPGAKPLQCISSGKRRAGLSRVKTLLLHSPWSPEEGLQTITGQLHSRSSAKEGHGLPHCRSRESSAGKPSISRRRAPAFSCDQPAPSKGKSRRGNCRSSSCIHLGYPACLGIRVSRAGT